MQRKRILSLIMVLTMMLSLFTVAASADSEIEAPAEAESAAEATVDAIPDDDGGAEIPADEPAPADESAEAAPVAEAVVTEAAAAEETALYTITVNDGAAAANTDSAVNAVHVYCSDSSVNPGLDDYETGATAAAGTPISIYVYNYATPVHLTVVHNGETVKDAVYGVVGSDADVEFIDVVLAGDLVVTTEVAEMEEEQPILHINDSELGWVYNADTYQDYADGAALEAGTYSFEVYSSDKAVTVTVKQGDTVLGPEELAAGMASVTFDEVEVTEDIYFIFEEIPETPTYVVTVEDKVASDDVVFTVGYVDMEGDTPRQVLVESGEAYEEGLYMGARVINDSGKTVALYVYEDGKLSETVAVAPGDANGHYVELSADTRFVLSRVYTVRLTGNAADRATAYVESTVLADGDTVSEGTHSFSFYNEEMDEALAAAVVTLTVDSRQVGESKPLGELWSPAEFADVEVTGDVAVDISLDGYVLMNIPYSVFYTSVVEQGDGVDAVTSSTGKKAAYFWDGSYKGNAEVAYGEGTTIYGVRFPVKIAGGDFAKLNTDLSAEQAYYFEPLDGTPALYAPASVADNGTVTLAAVVAEATALNATATITSETKHGDYLIALSDDGGILSAADKSSFEVYGVVLKTAEKSYALRHLINLYYKSFNELAFCTKSTVTGKNLQVDPSYFADLEGQTITELDYYTNSGLYVVTTSLYVGEPAADGYVLMNIPYSDFYAAEGVSGVDAVSSATLNKPRTATLAGGSYHQDADGSDISGVIYPVYVEDLSALAAYTQITDETSVDITVTNRGNTTTSTYTGKDALFEAPSYAYYVLSEEPALYKIRNADGSFSAVQGGAATVDGATGAVTVEGRHTYIEITLSGTDGIDSSTVVSGVVLTDNAGNTYGLRHVANLWRGTQIGWNQDEFDLVGKTITNIRYITQSAVINFPVEIEIALPTPVTTGWVKENGKWTFYDETGEKVVSGWATDEGKTYYFDANGVMQSGKWLSVDGSWYYLNKDGSRKEAQWFKSGGSWYYFAADGVMATGRQEIDGKTYVFAASGVMQASKWLQEGDAWYYVNASGVLATDWAKIGGKWYWFDESGVMATGTRVIDGQTYVFDANGVMQASKWVQDGDNWYYLNASGVYATGWQKLSGKWYYFETSGVMVTGKQSIDGAIYFFNTSGAMQSGKWVQDGSDWLYLNSSGAAYVSKWLKSGGSWYYFGSDGVMLSDTSREIGGKVYSFNASGVCTNP